jgi:hypothetical protein
MSGALHDAENCRVSEMAELVTGIATSRPKIGHSCRGFSNREGP